MCRNIPRSPCGNDRRHLGLEQILYYCPTFLRTKAKKHTNPPHTGDSKSCQYDDKAPHIPGWGGWGLLWLVLSLNWNLTWKTDSKTNLLQKSDLLNALLLNEKQTDERFQIFMSFNPLTPVPPVTARDKAWPFFLFWRHRFWPKLASSILNFCRRRRSFQWCPDQSDRPNGALDMHENAQKVEWKTWSKISCHYTWMLHAKIYPSRWRFLRSFLTTSKPSRRSITAAKTREKGRAKRKFQKSKLSQNYDFCACPSCNALTRDAGGKKGQLLCCKCIFHQIKGNLAEI